MPPPFAKAFRHCARCLRFAACCDRLNGHALGGLWGLGGFNWIQAALSGVGLVNIKYLLKSQLHLWQLKHRVTRSHERGIAYSAKTTGCRVRTTDKHCRRIYVEYWCHHCCRHQWCQCECGYSVCQSGTNILRLHSVKSEEVESWRFRFGKGWGRGGRHIVPPLLASSSAIYTISTSTKSCCST